MILAVGAPPSKTIDKFNFRPKSSLTPVKSTLPMQFEQRYTNLDPLYEINELVEKKGMEDAVYAPDDEFLSSNSSR